jgi:glycosyltransferase involved in cell wall biosynthesis
MDMNNIKICHVIITLSILGGAQRMLVRLLLANPQPNAKRMVLVLRYAGAWGDELRSAGVDVRELGMESFRDIPRIFLLLINYIKAFKPDIVQTWMYHADLLGGVAARITGCKNVIWGIRRTSLSWSDTKSTLLIMKICAFLSRWIPKKIVSVAEAGRIAHVQAGYDTCRMIVIANGFDFINLTATIEQRNTFRRECRLLEDEIVIGCLGRFNQAKGQDILVKAARLVMTRAVKVKFLLIGKDCDVSNQQLTNWIADNGLQEVFILMGERYDVPICLASMDIFCMPSRTEGFPNGLGEAMAMGLPCVATDVGDTQILVDDTALLVPSQDENALADGLLTLLNLTPDQRKQMGQRARIRVMKEFTMEKACERYNAIYRELILESSSKCVV